MGEAIIRHTNFVQGAMTTTGQLIQLSTTLDVIGANATLIDRSTYREIEAKWPRLGFNQHFARLMEEGDEAEAVESHDLSRGRERLLRQNQREPLHCRDRPNTLRERCTTSHAISLVSGRRRDRQQMTAHHQIIPPYIPRVECHRLYDCCALASTGDTAVLPQRKSFESSTG